MNTRDKVVQVMLHHAGSGLSHAGALAVRQRLDSAPPLDEELLDLVTRKAAVEGVETQCAIDCARVLNPAERKAARQALRRAEAARPSRPDDARDTAVSECAECGSTVYGDGAGLDHGLCATCWTRRKMNEEEDFDTEHDRYGISGIIARHLEDQ